METNTSPTPPRRRRAGNATALPSELPLVVPPEYMQEQPRSQSAPVVQSGPAFTAGPEQSAFPQPRPGVQAYPQYVQSVPARTPAASSQHRSTSAGQAQPYAAPAAQYSDASARPAQLQQPYSDPAYQRPRTAYPQVQGTVQPRMPYAAPARPGAQTPVRTPVQKTRPAGPRPQAYIDPNLIRREQAAERREKQAAERRMQRQEFAADAKETSVAKRRIPSRLWTLFTLMLIGVMGLVAVSTMMMAHLKTEADKRQEAWENTLTNYHVTQQGSGAFRVTWQDIIERYAGMYNLDPAFVTAIIRNESSFRTNATSSVGARGLMQMMPDTAEWIAGKLGESFDFDLLYDAETSIRYGCWYLNFLSELFQGDTVLVCAAYHAGQGEVLGWLGNSTISPDGVTVPIDNIPISNTKTYAGRVTQAYGIYKTLLYSPDPAAAAAVYGADPSVVGSHADR